MQSSCCNALRNIRIGQVDGGGDPGIGGRVNTSWWCDALLQPEPELYHFDRVFSHGSQATMN